MPYSDPKKAREYHKKWQAMDRKRKPEAWKGYSDKHEALLKKEKEEAKSGPCMDCGNQFPPECMDWDHRPGEIKYRNVSQIRGKEKLMAEISKCDLVCANCHRIRSKRRRNERIQTS